MERRGRRKERVLPLPVSDLMMQSSLEVRMGVERFWTSEGRR